jgi:glycoprotein endo-alpha-1,2-mannosidase
VEEHMKQISSAGIGIICVSWWGESDSQLQHIKGFTDGTLSLILDTAAKYHVTVCIHHEPYKGKTTAINLFLSTLEY